MDNEFILLDRLDVIRKVINKYGEDNFVISFSGGKDSTILHHLIDMAIPNNKISRVFIDTGIEYQLIRSFVNNFVENDDRFEIIKPQFPLGKIFKQYGYPFKSKEHSQLVHMFQQNGFSKSVYRYINPPEHRKRFGCPKILMYQFEEGNALKISKECCDKLKKQPFSSWQINNNKPYKLTGERVSEGGLRSSHGDCLVVDKQGKLKKFKPLNKVTDEWIEWFIKKYDIELCELYNEQFNFKRTGCLGCPYNLKISNDLNVLYDKLPNEYNKAIRLWKPVYDEYIRLGYRLKSYPHEKQDKKGSIR